MGGLGFRDYRVGGLWVHGLGCIRICEFFYVTVLEGF